MRSPDPHLFEALQSILGAYAVLIYSHVLSGQRSHSASESRLVFLLRCFLFLLVVRGFFWISHSPILGILTFASASLIPIGLFLYAEALIRRHFPLPAKIFILLGTLLFGTLALTGDLHTNHNGLLAYSVFITLTGAIISAVISTRDRTTLSQIENRMLDSLRLGAILCAPFFLTDLFADMGANVPRLGTCGAMIIVYTFSRVSSQNDTFDVVAKEIGKAAAFAVMTGFFLWTWGGNGAGEPSFVYFIRAVAFCFSITLLLLIRSRMRSLSYVHSQGSPFIRTLANSNVSCLSSFISSIGEASIGSSYAFMAEKDLSVYEPSKLLSILDTYKTEVLSLSFLHEHLDKAKGDDRYAIEQWIDLLETSGMTHGCFIRKEPIRLFLLHVPQVAYERAAQLEIGIIRKFAELIDQDSSNEPFHDPSPNPPRGLQTNLEKKVPAKEDYAYH